MVNYQGSLVIAMLLHYTGGIEGGEEISCIYLLGVIFQL